MTTALQCVKCGGFKGGKGVTIHLSSNPENTSPEQVMMLFQDAFSKVLSSEMIIPEDFYCTCRIGD